MTRARATRRVGSHALLATILLAGLWVAGPAPGPSPAGAVAFPDPGAASGAVVDTLDFDLGAAAFTVKGFPSPIELRGRVYAPAVLAGPAPVVLLLHGRHATCATGPDTEDVTLEFPCPAGTTEIRSNQGYDQLGRMLASHGMIVESVSANAINADDEFVADAGAAARASLLLRHLELWKRWGSVADGPFGTRFVGKVDLAQVGLMGHSRGGEGAVEAAIRNQRLGGPYGIKAVVALAPTDFGRRVLPSVPLQVVLPYCDGDVSDLQGATYYDDARYAVDGDPAPKAVGLLYGANHNYFNSVWTAGVPGAVDDWSYFGAEDPACSKGTPGRLNAPQQRNAGVALMGGFLRRFVLDDAALQPFVTGAAPQPTSFSGARVAFSYQSPTRLDLNRFADASTARTGDTGGTVALARMTPGAICSPDGPTPCIDATSFKVGPTAGRLEVGWVRPTAAVELAVPASMGDVSAYDGIRFRVALADDDRNARRSAQSLTVALTDAHGHTAAVVVGGPSSALARPPGAASAKTVLNGVRVPLARFAGVDLTAVRSLRIVADRTSSGAVGLSDVSFALDGTGPLGATTPGPVLSDPVRTPCLGAAWVNSRYTCTVVQGLLGRAPYLAELTSYRAMVGTADGRRAMVRFVMGGAEYRSVRRQALAQTVVEAPSAQGGIPGGDATVEASIESMITTMLMYSPEIASDAGRAVDAAYWATLRRPPSAAVRSAWVAKVASDPWTSLSALARQLVRSAGHARMVVDDVFRQYLGRAPSAAALAGWEKAFVAGTAGEARVVEQVLSSGELFASSS